MSSSKRREEVRDAFWKEIERQNKAYPKLWEACAKEDPSILSDDEPASEARNVKEEMQKEFDRQTVEFADLFEAFAKEDPSILDDDEPTEEKKE